MSDGGEHWTYRKERTVGIWEIHDWEQLFETELPEAEKHYNQTADSDEITGTVVVFDTVETVGGEMQEHITDAWSQLAQSVDGVERTAYVADGIAAMAVKSKVNAPDTELDSFESLEEAIEWASKTS